MNNLDRKYQELLREILNVGYKKEDRTGTGTTSIFGTSLKHKMNDGFPILTTKKVYWKGIVHELIWFLRGDTNIKYLVDNNVNIWNGDAYKKYCQTIENACKPGNEKILQEFSIYGFIGGNGKPHSLETFVNKIKGEKFDRFFTLKFGDLGPVYGKQWRNWTNYNSKKKVSHYDQIKDIIERLKNNPDDRRMIVSAWNVSEIDEMTLPPCHYSFQVWTRKLTLQERIDFYSKKHSDYVMIPEEKFLDSHNIPKRAISLQWNQRSVDTFLGLPFNIASYGLLLTMIAKVVNMIPEELMFVGGDTHIYNNHYSQCIEQLSKDGYDLPTIKFAKENYSSLEEFTFEDIVLENYKSEEAIKAPLSN